MSIVDIVIGLALLTAGVTLVIVVSLPLLASILLFFRSRRERARTQQAKDALAQIDENIDAGKFEDAAKSLTQAFVFRVRESRETSVAVREHNENVLSRCVVIAEGRGQHIENLARIEQLIIERSELELALIRSRSSYEKLASKRSKPLPTWTRTDFEKRSSEISAALNKNAVEFQQAVTELAAKLTSPTQTEVVYH